MEVVSRGTKGSQKLAKIPFTHLSRWSLSAPCPASSTCSRAHAQPLMVALSDVPTEDDGQRCSGSADGGSDDGGGAIRQITANFWLIFRGVMVTAPEPDLGPSWRMDQVPALFSK